MIKLTSLFLICASALCARGISIDVAIGTKNRLDSFKLAINNLNEATNADQLCLYIMDGNSDREPTDFMQNGTWRFRSISLYSDNEVEEIVARPGVWSVIYNYLLKQGSSPYLTYWSDDILLDSSDMLQQAVEILEHVGDCASGYTFGFAEDNTAKRLYRLPNGLYLYAHAVLRRSSFESVGGFDESFAFYYGDSDLTTRLYKEGFKTIVTPHFTVTRLRKQWLNPLARESLAVDRDLFYKKWSQDFINTIRLDSIIECS